MARLDRPPRTSPALAVLAVTTLLAAPARGQDVPAEKVVAAAKAATVLVKVGAGPFGGSGSGFVVRVDKDRVYVVTNQHVVEDALPADRPPTGPKESPKAGKVEVVFDSGTATERAYPAEILAADEEYDLAVLRVEGVKSPPEPIDAAAARLPGEATPVLVCGFPFGERLATGGRQPAVTIGRASVSSIRRDEAGGVEVVQLDGAVNPGNSGGPVLTTDGKLVGVTRATIRGAGLGFAIPHQRLSEVLKGRVGRVRVREVPGSGGQKTLRVTADVAAPFGGVNVKAARVYLLRTDGDAPQPVRPRDGAWPALPGAERVALAAAGLTAAAEVPAPGPLAALWAQTEFELADGTVVRGAPVRHVEAPPPPPIPPGRPGRPGRPAPDNRATGPVPNPPAVVPRPPKGAPSMLDLVRNTARFADGKPVTVHGAVTVQVAHRGGRFALNAANENKSHLPGLHFFVPRDLAADLTHLGRNPGALYPARLTVTRTPGGAGKGEAAYDVSRIEFFDDTGAVARTVAAGGGAAKPSPTLEDLDRNPELYAGKMLTLRGRAGHSGTGGQLSLHTEGETNPLNLDFRISADLALQCAAEWSGGGNMHPVAVALTVAADAGTLQRWQTAVSRIEVLDPTGEPVKVLESADPVLPPPAAKSRPVVAQSQPEPTPPGPGRPAPEPTDGGEVAAAATVSDESGNRAVWAAVGVAGIVVTAVGVVLLRGARRDEEDGDGPTGPAGGRRDRRFGRTAETE